MERKELIKKYIEYFKSKGHHEIPNSSLIPENDPTVLFTTAGMHPLVPYLLGQTHPMGKKLVGIQKCIRTGDIEEVGDTTHHTFFEMLGNWSLGDYFKKEAIQYSYEFLTKELGVPKEKLAVTVFLGDNDAPKDEESATTWKEQGITKIAYLSKGDNWWGPAGKTGPCGPDTEMFYWKGKGEVPETFDPNNKNWVEIWNDVLMQYIKQEDGTYKEATQRNIDTGMGVERTVAILEGHEDNYQASMWKPIIETIEALTEKKYGEDVEITKAMRIIADHIKAAVFIINDGITPSNTDQGYVLRRIIRRAIRYARNIGLEQFTRKLVQPILMIYNDYHFKEEQILEELHKEEEKFLKTLEKGLRVLEKVATKKEIDGKTAFLLYQSYGFPIEMTQEFARKDYGIEVDMKGYEEAQKEHQEKSRTAAKGRFEGGLADHSEETTRLHTAAHLLLEALRRVLGEGIHQKGSNITSERLRFDFNFERKLTEEEIKRIEETVNEAIQKEYEVTHKEMTLEEAKQLGAHGTFESKYKEKDKIKVYQVGDYSLEICGGPHVQNTKEMGTFKIKKQESSGAGVRRIKAILQ